MLLIDNTLLIDRNLPGSRDDITTNIDHQTLSANFGDKASLCKHQSNEIWGQGKACIKSRVSSHIIAIGKVQNGNQYSKSQRWKDFRYKNWLIPKNMNVAIPWVSRLLFVDNSRWSWEGTGWDYRNFPGQCQVCQLVWPPDGVVNTQQIKTFREK